MSFRQITFRKINKISKGDDDFFKLLSSLSRLLSALSTQTKLYIIIDLLLPRGSIYRPQIVAIELGWSRFTDLLRVVFGLSLFQIPCEKTAEA